MRSPCSCALILLLLLVNGCASPVSDPDRAVCMVNVEGSQGTGTLIAVRGDMGLVLCCRHVCEVEGRPVRLDWIGAEGQVTKGIVYRVIHGQNFCSDVALIVCYMPEGVEPLKVAKFDPSKGPWRGIGYRGGKQYETIASGAREEGGLITLNQPLIGGMSGGALRDRDDNVVGVTVGTNGTESVCADGEYLHGLLAEVGE